MHWLRLNGEVIGGIAAEAISPLFGNRLPTTLPELRFILSENQDCLQENTGDCQIMIESIKVVVRTRSQLCCLDYLLASSPPVPRQENCPPPDLMPFLRGGHYKEVSNDRFSTDGCLKSVNVAAQMHWNLNILQAMINYIFIIGLHFNLHQPALEVTELEIE